MKRFLFIVLFTFTASSASSQILISILFGDKLNNENLEFGLETGVNWSTISGMEGDGYRSNLNLGLYFDIKFKKNWSLYTSILFVSSDGSEKLSSYDLDRLNFDSFQQEGTYGQKTEKFVLSSLGRYQLPKWHLGFEAGLQYSLAYNSKITWRLEDDDFMAYSTTQNEEELTAFDTGGLIGMDYTLMKGKGVALGIQYYYGFLNVYKNISNTRNQRITLKVCVPIGAKPKQE